MGKSQFELFSGFGGAFLPPTGEIRLSGMRLKTVLGVHPDERVAPREVVADVRLFLDLERASRTDDLADTVDYAALADRLCDVASRSAFHLIEAFAGALAREALSFAPSVRAVSVTVEKPGAVPGADVSATAFLNADNKK